MNRYLTLRRANASRISSAWRYSNAAITQPRRQRPLAPLAIGGHRVERADRAIVQPRLCRMNERVAHAERERAPSCSLEVGEPLGGYVGGRRAHGAIIP